MTNDAITPEAGEADNRTQAMGANFARALDKAHQAIERKKGDAAIKRATTEALCSRTGLNALFPGLGAKR